MAFAFNANGDCILQCFDDSVPALLSVYMHASIANEEPSWQVCDLGKFRL